MPGEPEHCVTGPMQLVESVEAAATRSAAPTNSGGITWTEYLLRRRELTPPGYRTWEMIWRFWVRHVRLSTAGDYVYAKIGIQKEQGMIWPQDWPEEGIPVIVELHAELQQEPALQEARLLLTADVPELEAKVPQHELATFIVAKPEKKETMMLSSFASLPSNEHRGMLIPLWPILGCPMPMRSKASGALGAPDFLVMPGRVPIPGEDDEIVTEKTGLQVWDACIVHALSLPWLLSAGPQQGGRALEIGSGYAVVGLAAAMLGWNCTATDLGTALELATQTAKANAQAIANQGGAWNVEELDWRDPPAWALETCWDVVLGADLLYESAYFVRLSDMGTPQGEMHDELLSLLCRLRFRECLLSDRLRHEHYNAVFFSRLNEFGLEAVEDTRFVPGGGGFGNTPLTPAIDVKIWCIRHSESMDTMGFLNSLD